MDRFPCIDVLMVGLHSSSHYKFLRVMDDPAFQVCEFVLQVWDEGRRRRWSPSRRPAAAGSAR